MPKSTQKQKAKPSSKFTLGLLARAISEQWPTDPTTPGVVCSFLPYEPAGSQFYISIVRYSQQFGHGKRVVFASKAESFDAAARKVAEMLVAPTALKQLADSL